MPTFLITGGAGSLGRKLVAELIAPKYGADAIRVFDNHENSLAKLKLIMDDNPLVRYFLGDIRDKDRVERAMEHVDIVIHAAAQKHVDISEKNPFECLNINVMGTQNCIDAALKADVDKFIYISSDKACQAISTYGRCKALSESLTLDANNYKGDKRTKFSVCRPPNYIESDGSIFEIWKYQKENNLPITVTDERMTRYFMNFPDIINFIMKSVLMMRGGETFIPTKVQEMKIIDLARKMSDNIKIIGKRRGERLEEFLFDPAEIEHSTVIEDILVVRQ